MEAFTFTLQGESKTHLQDSSRTEDWQPLHETSPSQDKDEQYSATPTLREIIESPTNVSKLGVDNGYPVGLIVPATVLMVVLLGIAVGLAVLRPAGKSDAEDD